MSVKPYNVGYKLRYSKDVGAEDTFLWIPHVIQPNAIPLVMQHGASATDVFARVTWPKVSALVQAAVSAGIPCIAAADAGDTYANDTMMSRIDTKLAFVAAQTGCRADKAHLLGISMGGGASARYASLYPAKTASVTAIIPMSNLYYHYAFDNPAGIRAGIATAWALTNRIVTDGVVSGTTTFTSPAQAAFVVGDTGGPIVGTGIPAGTTMTYVNATTVTLSQAATNGAVASTTLYKPLATSGAQNADLATLAVAMRTAGIPSQFFYSTVDTLIRVQDVTALAAAAGSPAVPIDATFGHADGTVGRYAPSAFANFLATYS